jgi:hypothetical protein
MSKEGLSFNTVRIGICIKHNRFSVAKGLIAKAAVDVVKVHFRSDWPWDLATLP